MGGNFRSGRAGGCGNPQAQIDFVLLAGSGLRGNAKPFFCAKCAFAESPNSYIFKRSRRVCVHKKKRSAKAQKASRKSTDGLLFLLSVFAARTGFLSASQWAQKNGRVLCACARFAASSPLRRIFYRTARTTVSDCRRRRVLRTLQALHVGRRLVWSELRRGFSRTSRP